MSSDHEERLLVRKRIVIIIVSISMITQRFRKTRTQMDAGKTTTVLNLGRYRPFFKLHMLTPMVIYFWMIANHDPYLIEAMLHRCRAFLNIRDTAAPATKFGPAGDVKVKFKVHLLHGIFDFGLYPSASDGEKILADSQSSCPVICHATCSGPSAPSMATEPFHSAVSSGSRRRHHRYRHLSGKHNARRDINVPTPFYHLNHPFPNS
jgi:hypothetical protein